MKTQNEMRSKFEKLKEIADKLENLFFEDGFYFRKYDDADSDEYFVNGAWYAFQEQQKKIDVKNKKILYLFEDYKLRSYDFNMDFNSCINEMVGDLEELLK